jgi:hypothetical protein
MKYCNNISDCHNPYVINEDANALRWICNNCKQIGIIRKDWRGVPENREYSRVFKRDVLQGNDNLLYKYHPEFLKT